MTSHCPDLSAACRAGSLASPLAAAFRAPSPRSNPSIRRRSSRANFNGSPPARRAALSWFWCPSPSSGSWSIAAACGSALSTCSTGKPVTKRLSGVFVILQKDKDHHSSTYNNAPMPYMERLTWQGVALHAGNLPGYPASHGCIRLPLEFAKLLFGVTTLGTPVIVADGDLATADISILAF